MNHLLTGLIVFTLLIVACQLPYLMWDVLTLPAADLEEE